MKLFSRSRWVRTAASEKVRLPPNPTGFDDPGDIIIFENEFGLLQIDGRPSLLSRSLYEITSCRLYGLKNFSLSFSLPMDNAGDSHVGQPGATNAGQDPGATGGMNLGNSALFGLCDGRYWTRGARRRRSCAREASNLLRSSRRAQPPQRERTLRRPRRLRCHTHSLALDCLLNY